MLLDPARTHPRVAGDLLVGMKASLLALPRLTNPFADRGGGFFCAFTRNLPVINRRHFDVQINSIEERAGDALAITLDLGRTATALAFEIPEISARTGVHRGDEHELGREGDRARGTRDRDPAILERLA